MIESNWTKNLVMVSMIPSDKYPHHANKERIEDRPDGPGSVYKLKHTM